MQIVRCLLEGIDGRVGAEECDPPAAGAHGEPEADQSEVVQLAGRAGEQGQRTAALTPVAGQAEQPAAEDVGREVLLGNARQSGAPAFSQVSEVVEHDLPEQRIERKHAQRPVECAVGGGLVEPVERVGERLPQGVGGLGGAVLGGAVRAATAGERPCSWRASMRRTRSSSAVEYSRKPPSVRVGRSTP